MSDFLPAMNLYSHVAVPSPVVHSKDEHGRDTLMYIDRNGNTSFSTFIRFIPDLPPCATVTEAIKSAEAWREL